MAPFLSSHTNSWNKVSLGGEKDTEYTSMIGICKARTLFTGVDKGLPGQPQPPTSDSLGERAGIKTQSNKMVVPPLKTLQQTGSRVHPAL